VFGGENDRPLVDTTLDRRVSAIGSARVIGVPWLRADWVLLSCTHQ